MTPNSTSGKRNIDIFAFLAVTPHVAVSLQLRPLSHMAREMFVWKRFSR
jgi:hypothetical protein